LIFGKKTARVKVDTFGAFNFTRGHLQLLVIVVLFPPLPFAPFK
jgi:hypothetical protein